MLIELITEDFKYSSYCNGTDCPLARCLKRYFPKSEILIYGWGIIKKDDKFINAADGWDKQAGIPGWGEIARNLIEQADAGEEVSYKLEIPGLRCVR